MKFVSLTTSMEKIACGVRVICDDDDKFDNFSDSLAHFDEMCKDSFECDHCDFEATKGTDGALLFQHIKKKCCKQCGKKFTCAELFEKHRCGEPQRTPSPSRSISLRAIKMDYQSLPVRAKYQPPPRRKKRPKKLCLCCFDDYENVVCEKCAKEFQCKNVLEGHFAAHLEAMSRRGAVTAESDDDFCSPLSPDGNSKFADYGLSDEEAPVAIEFVTVKNHECEICHLTCPNYSSLKSHWHLGKCFECGRSMRCATEVLEHHRACNKINALLSNFLPNMLDMKGDVSLILQILLQNAESAKTTAVNQEPSVDADEETANVTPPSSDIDGKLYFVKQETLLVPEGEYLNNAVTSLVGDDLSPSVLVKQEPSAA